MAVLSTHNIATKAFTGSRPSLTPRVGASSRSCRSRSGAVQVKALMTPPQGDKKKKFISREEEPDQYWSSKGEKDGVNPFKDPIAIVGILAIFFPFIFLAVAIGTGAVDVSVYR